MTKMTKKIKTRCCTEIIADEKDIKTGVWKKKGWEFEVNVGKETKKASFCERWFWYMTQGVSRKREVWQRFRLEKDIKLKYLVCPVCSEKIWFNEPSHYSYGLPKEWEVTKLKESYGKWEIDFERSWF